MERRAQARRRRRVQVYFWERGATNKRVGYTVNISTSGMFIATNQPASKGRRIRVEVVCAPQGFIVEALVARVVRSTQALQALRQSGMGVRFLAVEELVGELIPEIGARPPAPEQPAPETGVFPVWFANRKQFFAVYQRDIATGGLFVPTNQPAQLHEVITVELRIGESGLEPLRFQARVVQRIEPGMPGGAGANLMAGMGVELLSYDQTTKAMRALLGAVAPAAAARGRAAST